MKQRENLGQGQGSKPHDIPEEEAGAGPTVAEGPQKPQDPDGLEECRDKSRALCYGKFRITTFFLKNWPL